MNIPTDCTSAALLALLAESFTRAKDETPSMPVIPNAITPPVASERMALSHTPVRFRQPASYSKFYSQEYVQ